MLLYLFLSTRFFPENAAAFVLYSLEECRNFLVRATFVIRKISSSPTLKFKCIGKRNINLRENYNLLIIGSNKVHFSFVSLLQNLKSHAVTMFEVGKLSDESLDSFLIELEKVNLDSLLWDVKAFAIFSCLIKHQLLIM